MPQQVLPHPIGKLECRAMLAQQESLQIIFATEAHQKNSGTGEGRAWEWPIQQLACV